MIDCNENNKLWIIIEDLKIYSLILQDYYFGLSKK